MQATRHQMNRCILVSISTLQKKHVLDFNSLLFSEEPNGSPPIITLQINTLECQLHCNNGHHSTLDLHTSHSFCAFEETQESEVIEW